LKKEVVAAAKMDNITSVSEETMFRLTRQEQLIVGFVLSMILLGTVVREWHARHPKAASVAASEIRGH
jgi:hypothetical protein